MQLQGIRVPVVALSLAFGLFLFFGLERLYLFTQVDQPLAHFLHERSDVRSFSVSDQGNRILVKIALGPVGNLRETYVSLEKGMAGIFGQRPFAIEITDNRTERLVQDFYSIHYILQEGLATGRFTEMEQKVSEVAGRNGLSQAAVYVDTRYLYVQLRRGDHYLYELVPRQPGGTVPVAPGEVGGKG